MFFAQVRRISLSFFSLTHSPADMPFRASTRRVFASRRAKPRPRGTRIVEDGSGEVQLLLQCFLTSGLSHCFRVVPAARVLVGWPKKKRKGPLVCFFRQKSDRAPSEFLTHSQQ